MDSNRNIFGRFCTMSSTLIAHLDTSSMRFDASAKTEIACVAVSEIRKMVQRSYKVPSTLIVQFEGDSFDESDLLEELLKDGERYVEKSVLIGMHATPREFSTRHVSTLTHEHLHKHGMLEDPM